MKKILKKEISWIKLKHNYNKAKKLVILKNKVKFNNYYHKIRYNYYVRILKSNNFVKL